MNKLDFQKTYWDSVADKKTFTHPIQYELFSEFVAPEGKILDYGCGYGRSCAELEESGYLNVVGVDISEDMIERGKVLDPSLNLHQVDNEVLPYADNTFTACTLLAVLTCMPTNSGQTTLIKELYRVLEPKGILYISDYPLQSDIRNNERYQRFENEFGTFGVFRLSDGGVVRHHDLSWISELLSPFNILKNVDIEVSTMNGNKAQIFQTIARKE